ncbi:MAG: SUMF1/EgtB/PvdO family nonheme iron enzyme [Candidatus Sedimenticola endophacoides]
MHCQECGHENKSNAKFCTACGAPLQESTRPAEQAGQRSDPRAAAQAVREQAKDSAKADAVKSRQGLLTLFYPIPKPIWVLGVLGLIGWGGWQAAGEVDWDRLEAQCQCPVMPAMVAIPGGGFTMGGHEENEKPRHTVTIKPFRLGRYEVTFDEWDRCYQTGGCSRNPGSEGWGRGQRPVINVSWNDVQDYIDWLNEKTDGEYRLPSEAEWEYAARAGSKGEYSWGNSINCSKANYGYNDCGISETVEVGSYKKNAFGLYDMHGNVWEWTEDCWNGNYRGAPANGSAWKGGDCSDRMFRGGSWSDPPENLRAAYRNWTTRGNLGSNLGFRLAQDN